MNNLPPAERNKRKKHDEPWHWTNEDIEIYLADSIALNDIGS
jgi:hypothetical protein